MLHRNQRHLRGDASPDQLLAHSAGTLIVQPAPFRMRGPPCWRGHIPVSPFPGDPPPPVRAVPLACVRMLTPVRAPTCVWHEQ